MPRRSRAKTLDEGTAVRERPAPETPPDPAYEPCPRCKEPVPVQTSYHHECLLYPPETMLRVCSSSAAAPAEGYRQARCGVRKAPWGPLPHGAECPLGAGDEGRDAMRSCCTAPPGVSLRSSVSATGRSAREPGPAPASPERSSRGASLQGSP